MLRRVFQDIGVNVIGEKIELVKGAIRQLSNLEWKAAGFKNLNPIVHRDM